MKTRASIHRHFSKQKNYQGVFFITGFHKKSERFSVGTLKNNAVAELGSFSEGLKKEEKSALEQIINKKAVSRSGLKLQIAPGICVELAFTKMEKRLLTNPRFLRFRTDIDWTECTWGNLLIGNDSVKQEVHITHPDKPLWKEPPIVKDQYISYLYEIAPLILPFLQQRMLTVLRYPHGIHGEGFYQKNCPAYAPEFIKTYLADDIHYIVCNDLSTLLWLGNQLALEFHVPFHHIGNANPYEIVFDLDPPSQAYFPLAVKAALEMKQLFDKFSIQSYPKISGNKGLQIHVPMADAPLTFEEARHFTSFIAAYIVEKHPHEFTVERMKKKRGNRLYIDYVQHWRGKTIICPYSTRGREGAPVAAPLSWEEVTAALRPDQYNIFTVLERINKIGCPFHDYFEQKNEHLLEMIKKIKAVKA
ncbi:bifunctional non-homologous end joining protein LigD [Evansella caseinilytica]|uniref:Bifunctional non-homologous end joining protein LigD n=1 Tax=Evansella caseinilytica TaxID=1503961 RepID=A0A1H3TUV7_9BACI|nr:DNA ligase D [Evansella caseinilytica]SDZ53986.1 bifunctional non-homologous end joining protein LigD [Evansella caseinilytica]